MTIDPNFIQNLDQQIYLENLKHGYKLTRCEVEDLVSDALIQVLESKTFDPEKGNIQAYIAIAAHNKCKSVAKAKGSVRKGTSRSQISMTSYDCTDGKSAWNITAEDCFSADYAITATEEYEEAILSINHIHAAISELPDAQRRTAEMLEAGMSVQEIASAEHVAANIIYKRVFDLRKALSRTLVA